MLIVEMGRQQQVRTSLQFPIEAINFHARTLNFLSLMIKSFIHFLFPPKPGQSQELPIEISAVPGLTTFCDVALFRANEGQLTATTCSSHALLACWLDVKHQSQYVLQVLVDAEENDSNAKLSCESFCRQCLESSMDAIERLSTDKLSQTANLSDPYESISATAGAGGHHHLLSGVGVQGIASGILESKNEIGRRYPLQKLQDCWESPRLHCPDYVWADDAYQACQRWIRNLTKHPFYLRENDAFVPLAGSQNHHGNHHNNHLTFSNNEPLHPSSERQASVLIQLIHEDVPMRLHHFRQAMYADEAVTQRLYLVKCEYRAPFRHFLEAHQSLLRAPAMDLVDHYLKNPSPNAESLKSQLQSLLKTPELVELFALEKECEEIELDMGQALFPFSELARTLDHKKARLKVVPGAVEEDKLAALQETVRVSLPTRTSTGKSCAFTHITSTLVNYTEIEVHPLSQRRDRNIYWCPTYSNGLTVRSAGRRSEGSPSQFRYFGK